MPLRAAQLFVRCGSLDELGEALSRGIQRLDRAGTYLALHEQGWAAIAGDSIEPALSQSLSERFGTALVLDLDGSALALSVQTWEAGVPGEEELDPRPPAFRDVEAVAWELLQYLGVPPSLRLLELGQIEIAGSGLPALLVRGEIERIFALPPPRAEGPSPPAEPDAVVESKAGETRALEVRDLPGGIPTDAWADALAAIEEAQSRRLLHALAATDEPRVPRPAFAYRTLQPLRMEKLLAKARKTRPWLARLFDPEREAPLSLAGFNQLARAKLSDAPVARAHGEHLELLADDVCVRAPVHEVYEVYLTTLDEHVAAAELAARAKALLDAPGSPFDEGNLLPTLLAGEPIGRAAREIGPGLYAALLHDDGVRIAPVPEVPDFDRALAKAIDNVDARTDAAPEGIRWFDLEHGRIVTCEFPDAACAGRLLSRRARELLLSVLGEDQALAAAPTRDALLACAASDDEGALWLRGEAARRFAEGPFPIAPAVWLIDAAGLRVADVGAGASVKG
ncbi:MAG: hypothetical protein LC689_15530 [Myxococcales bacterium]|nr:hypothetical protein [Myxococcales bacterium]